MKRLFRIPDYQRGYAWRSDADKEVVAFWNDLLNLSDEKYHFTGSLTLQEMTDKEQLGNDKWLTTSQDFSPWYVVDGQQRLTTIIIFLQCIYEFLDCFPDEQEFLDLSIAKIKQTIRDKYICRINVRGITSYLFGYANNPASDNYFRREVFNDLNYVINEKSYYTLNVKNAKDFFKKNIKQYYDKQGNLEAVGVLYNKLTKQLRFQLIEVKQSDDFNIFVAFETINNRGRQLSNLEKLKNRLIYLTTLYKEDYTHIRESINSAWKEVYCQLGRNANHMSKGKVAVLDDDEFLRTHWILYYQYSRKTGNDCVNYLLGKKFTVQNVLQNLAQTESTQELVRDDETEYVDDAIEQDTNTVLNENSLCEGTRLEHCIKMHKRLFKVDAKKIGGDTGYAGTANRNLCKEMGIQTSFVNRGRPTDEKTEKDYVRQELARVRATQMEGSFGTQKEHYAMRRIKARKKKTEILYIFFGIHTANVVHLAERLAEQEQTKAA